MGEGRKRSAGLGTRRPLPPSQDAVEEFDPGPQVRGLPGAGSSACGLWSGGGVCDGVEV